MPSTALLSGRVLGKITQGRLRFTYFITIFYLGLGLGFHFFIGEGKSLLAVDSKAQSFGKL